MTEITRKTIFLDAGTLSRLFNSGSWAEIYAHYTDLGYDFGTTDALKEEFEKLIAKLEDGGANPENYDLAKLRQGLRDIHSGNIKIFDASAYPGRQEKGLVDLLQEADSKGVSGSQAWIFDRAFFRQASQIGSPSYHPYFAQAYDSFRTLGDFTFPDPSGSLSGIEIKGIISELADTGLHANSVANVRNALAATDLSNSEVRPLVNGEKPPKGWVDLSLPAEIESGVVRSSGGLAETYYKYSSDPAPEGWVSEVDLSRPEISDLAEKARGQYNADLNDFANDPTAFDGDGNYTPEGAAKFNKIAKAFEAAGWGLALFDAVTSGMRAHGFIENGDYQAAQDELFRLSGRLLLGLEGAYAGAAYFGGLGPYGAIIGGILGGAAGAFIGDGAFKQISDWVSDLLGPLFQPLDPLVFDLGSDGVQLLSLDQSQIFFDLDSDGFAERTGWVSASDGLLALDRNGDGTINNGNELFGSSFEHGFEALAELDSNGDGVISALDTRFSELRIWRDENSNGISESSELHTLETYDFQSITLASQSVKNDRAGNTVIATGEVLRGDGSSAEAIAVNFLTDRVNSQFIVPEGFEFDPQVFWLPNLRGYGEVPDLWVAMSLDPVLKQMVQDYLSNPPQDVKEAIGSIRSEEVFVWVGSGQARTETVYKYDETAFEDILVRWTGADGGILEVAEKLLGRLIPHVEYSGGVHDPRIFPLLQNFSAELAVRFFTEAVQLSPLQRGVVNISEWGLTADQAQAAAWLNGFAAASDSNHIDASPIYQQFQNLTHSFQADVVSGDGAVFLESLMGGLSVDLDSPWQTVSDWFAEYHSIVAAVEDGSGKTFERALRIHTANEYLPINQFAPEKITGTDGADVIDAPEGTYFRYLINAGQGNDLIKGGLASDTFVFRPGFGQDELFDGGGQGDELAFQGGITAADVSLSFTDASRSTVLLSVRGTSDSILIHDLVGPSGRSSIEQISFTNGTVWYQSDILDQLMQSMATGEDDSIEGFAVGSAIYGAGGNDHLVGKGGSDSLWGDQGNDVLEGRDGGDIYNFSWGGGNDLIREGVTDVRYGDFDILRFGESVSPADISLSRTGDDLTLTLDQGTSITIEGQFRYSAYFTWNDIELFQFEDGTEWTSATVRARLLASTDNDDHIVGFDGDDVIDGGKGDDILEGLNGADTYKFSRGDGHDRIIETLSNANLSDFDRLIFGPSIAVSDIVFTRDGNDLVATIQDSGESITIEGQFNFSNWFAWNDIERFEFADGTVLSAEKIAAQILGGTPGDDNLVGTFRSDTLDGGAGNDILAGGDGADLYIFGRGYGQDEIRENLTNANLSDDDELRFGPGIAESDLVFERQGNDLLITISGTSDSVKLVNQWNFSSWYTWQDVERFSFDDGSYITKGDVQAKLLASTDGDDHLVGFMSGDRLDGGLGNDILEGSNGSDTYVFGLGYGHDEIVETVTNANLSDDDSIEFGPGIAWGDLQFSRAGDDVTISLAGGQDSVLIRGQLGTATETTGYTWRDIENFRFDDGTVKSKADLRIAILAQSATDGDDVIYDFYTNDVITGGKGNDTLYGGRGSDIYVHNIGDGHDIVSDHLYYYGSANDKVVFGPGISPDDVKVGISASGNDMVLTVFDGQSSVTLRNQVNGGNDWQIDFVEFSDGTVWDKTELANRLVEGQGTAGNDIIEGTSSADILYAGAGNDVINAQGGSDELYGGSDDDTLNGGDGNDRLVGGTGNDLLKGNNNNDTYVYAMGDGYDVIDEWVGYYGSYDILELGAGLTADDVRIAADGNSYVVTFANAAGSLTIYNMRSGNYGGREGGVNEFRFTDGTIWSRADIDATYLTQQTTTGDDIIYGTPRVDTIEGGEGNDKLYGGDGNDRLIGGTGDDLLQGNGSDDTYVYALGDGHDVIDEWVGYYGSYDILELGEGITADDVRIAADGNSYVVTFANTEGSLTIYNMRSGNYGGREGGVNEFRFADGTAWTRSDIDTIYLTQQTTAGDDIIYGTPRADSIEGGQGNDTLHGGDGNDRLIGGEGSDLLKGNGGGDTYVYALGDGDDIVDEFVGYYGSFDILELGVGIDSESLRVFKEGGNLKLTFLDGAGSVLLKNQIDVGNYGGREFGINEVRFASGETWSRTDLKNHIWITGDNEDNRLIGSSGNDRIDGGAGNDTLYGRAGADQFIAGPGADDMFGEDGDDLFFADEVASDIDLFHGGAGSDTVSFEEFSVGVEANLTSQYTPIPILSSGDMLLPGERKDAYNGRYYLTYQTDGNLVLYDRNDVAKWSSNTSRKSTGHAEFQNDGNLVVFDAGGTAVWSTNVQAAAGAELFLRGDGALDIRSTSGSIWTANGSAISELAVVAGDDWISIENIRGSNFDDMLTGNSSNNRLDGGGGDDMIVQFGASGGRDIIDGQAGTDTYKLLGSAEAEDFTIYTRDAWLGIAGNLAGNLSAATEIVVTLNGSDNAHVISELNDIEEIIVDTLNVTPAGPGAPVGGSTGGGDTVTVVGDFTTTSLNYNTITVNSGISADIVDISGLQSDHRLVFNGGGGADTVVGALRPQDVVDFSGSGQTSAEIFDTLANVPVPTGISGSEVTFHYPEQFMTDRQIFVQVDPLDMEIGLSDKTFDSFYIREYRQAKIGSSFPVNMKSGSRISKDGLFGQSFAVDGERVLAMASSGVDAHPIGGSRSDTLISRGTMHPPKTSQDLSRVNSKTFAAEENISRRLASIQAYLTNDDSFGGETIINNSPDEMSREGGMLAAKLDHIRQDMAAFGIHGYGEAHKLQSGPHYSVTDWYA